MVDSLQKVTNTKFSNWMRCQTSELISQKKLAIGDGYRAKNSELCPLKSGLVFARAGNINQGFKFDNADYLAKENLTRAGEKISEEGDVLFTSKGTVGRVAFVSNKTKKFVYSPQLSWWRIRDKSLIEPRFLYYWMFGKEFSLQINSFKGQTDMADCVSLRDQRQMYITIPPLPEQKAIAQILGSLDDKIELNRQMNQTLEKIAWTIFKSWFKEDSFPDDWRFLALEDCMAEIIDYRGKTPKKTSFGIPLITAKIVKDGRIKEPKEFIAQEDYDSWMRRGIPECGDVVMTTEAPLGEIAQLNGLKVALAQRLITLRGKLEVLDNTYLKFLMQSHFVQEQINSRATGTTVLGIRQSELRKVTLVIPPISEQQKISLHLRNIEDKIGANEEQSRTLASIRDTLLPKLLSGKIRVKEAEKIVETVT